MKITGTEKLVEDLVHGLEAGAAVRELDICEDEAGPCLVHGLDRLGMRARDVDDAMAEFFDQGLKVERDERFVLDDQHVSADLVGDLLAGTVDQRGRLVDRAIEGARNLRGLEAFE